MKGFTCGLVIIIAVLSFSCESTAPSFDETVPDLYTLSVKSTPDEGGILNPSEGEFVDGISVEIEAVSSDGFLFERWEGDISGDSNPVTVVMSQNTSVTAVFKEIEYSLNVDIVGEGNVNKQVDNQTVSLTAEPADGWGFSYWEGDLTGTQNPNTLIVDEQKNITAVFEEQFTLDIQVEGNGSVDVDPHREYYNAGDEITLSASAERGWAFIEWKGDLNGDENPVTIAIDQDKTITAVFEFCLFCNL